MGGVEGPPISAGFCAELMRPTEKITSYSVTRVKERHAPFGKRFSSAREPAEIGGPSTPPMLPRSAQDDSFFGALSLRSMRQHTLKML